MSDINLIEEARSRGVPNIGNPVRHLYVIYMDEFNNEYIIRRGILTIVSADGRVY